ncbi:EAL domain-containing protein [uncultured Thiodictyon sp.]|uniref:putative bifunctional diguanylate cyclase/phosphodiesterase n=1 Tax=uncultured Thiodictyon sp. TaxID=1846217 RepID=UPI0025D4E102|nr:EAL domain-containing protein [uncultured Thiodictyon sp.]
MTVLKDLSDRSLTQVLAALRQEVQESTDLRQVVHDLHVHQIELELQNRELRAAQQALEESRDRYADLYDFAPVGYVTLQRNGQVTQMNLTAARLLGRERGRTPLLFLGTRLDPRAGSRLLSALARVLESGEPESLEVGLRPPPPATQTRDLRLLIERAAPPPAMVEPPACRVVLLDVTEIKQAQAAVMAERQFLQAVIDGAGDPLLVVTPDYRVLLMNAAARAAAGSRTGTATQPLTCYLATHGRDTPCAGLESPCPVRSVLASGQPTKVVHRHREANGEERAVELLASPLRGPQGEVLGVIESARDITEHLRLTAQLQEREEQLEHLAEHDPLTGLPNRRLFADRLTQAMRRAHRERHQVALLFLDLDDFKGINDRLGHAAGDCILQQAAQRMRALVREGDTVARLGGDEFIVILGALERGDAAARVAQALVEAFAAPFELDSQRLRVTASIGISLYPQDGTDVDTLVRNADSAMYLAKAQGHDTFRFYTQEMTERALAHVTLETALRQALDQREFVLHYQPQHELASGRIVGLEALIRWHHPTLGLVAPDRFIPLAEATGLIVPIGAWAMRTAAAQMQAWQAQGLLAGVAVTVNLSSRDLSNPHLTQDIGAIVAELGLPPGTLTVEATETWIMANPEAAAENIRRLAKLGIAVGIDDFGTGYSSLATLKRLPVRALKIDRSFVAGLPGGADDRAIATAILTLGRALNLTVIAAGIETRAQADCLKAAGCRIGQGFLYSRPLPAAACAAYCREAAAMV